MQHYLLLGSGAYNSVFTSVPGGPDPGQREGREPVREPTGRIPAVTPVGEPGGISPRENHRVETR